MLERAQAIQDGFPTSALRSVLSDGVVRVTDLVDIVAKRRTLDRRLATDDQLTTEESDRLARFGEVLALATYVFGERKEAMEWLRAPQFDFDGIPPITMMRTHAGGDLVVNLLNRFRHGMLA